MTDSAVRAPEVQRAHAPAKRSRNAGRWIALAAIAAILALAAWLALRPGDQPVQTREITGNTTQEIVSQMQQLVDENTR